MRITISTIFLNCSSEHVLLRFILFPNFRDILCLFATWIVTIVIPRNPPVHHLGQDNTSHQSMLAYFFLPIYFFASSSFLPSSSYLLNLRTTTFFTHLDCITTPTSDQSRVLSNPFKLDHQSTQSRLSATSIQFDSQSQRSSYHGRSYLIRSLRSSFHASLERWHSFQCFHD